MMRKLILQRKPIIYSIYSEKIKIIQKNVSFTGRVIHELHNFFMNEFGGKTRYPVLYRGKLTTVELANPLLEFSDDRFDAEMNEFIHGYSNRFKPVQVPNTEGLDVRLRFKGYSITAEQYANGMRENGKMIERDLTWVDIFYMVAVAATEDKVAIITRYPVKNLRHYYSNIVMNNYS